jgi:hypothetical protein
MNQNSITAACLLVEEGDEKLRIVNKHNLQIISMKWFALKFSKMKNKFRCLEFLY